MPPFVSRVIFFTIRTLCLNLNSSHLLCSLHAQGPVSRLRGRHTDLGLCAGQQGLIEAPSRERCLLSSRASNSKHGAHQAPASPLGQGVPPSPGSSSGYCHSWCRCWWRGPFNILPLHIKNLIPPTMSWVNQWE